MGAFWCRVMSRRPVAEEKNALDDQSILAAHAMPAVKLPPFPTFRLMSGRVIPGVFVDLAGGKGDVVRERVAGALGWPTICVRLIEAAGGRVIFDTDSLSYDGDGEVLVLVDREALEQATLALDGNILLSTNKLCYAAQMGKDEAIKLLLLSGEDPNLVDEHRKNQSALHVAATFNRAEITKLLLSANADVNLSDDSGFTALHCAAEKRSALVFKALLGAGADRNHAAVSRTNHTRRGDTPTQIIVRCGDISIIEDFADGVVLADAPTFIMPE